jgi:hypothetical protein
MVRSEGRQRAIRPSSVASTPAYSAASKPAVPSSESRASGI